MVTVLVGRSDRGIELVPGTSRLMIMHMNETSGDAFHGQIEQFKQFEGADGLLHSARESEPRDELRRSNSVYRIMHVDRFDFTLIATTIL